VRKMALPWSARIIVHAAKGNQGLLAKPEKPAGASHDDVASPDYVQVQRPRHRAS